METINIWISESDLEKLKDNYPVVVRPFVNVDCDVCSEEKTVEITINKK